MLNDLLTIEEARRLCNISFYHAWDFVCQGKWTPVRVGHDSRIIRVRRSEVEATRDRWAAEDIAAKAAMREANKSKRKAMKRAA